MCRFLQPSSPTFQQAAFLTRRGAAHIIILLQKQPCECGGTAYTADLKSAGETLGVRIPPFAPTIKGYPNGYPLIVGLVIEGIRRAVKKTVLRTVFPARILCQADLRGMECKQGDADDQNLNPPSSIQKRETRELLSIFISLSVLMFVSH